jgi:hypothetical protein
MRPSKITLSVLMLGFALAAGTARAEIVRIKSKVSSVNVTDGYLKIYRLDPQSGATEEISLVVDDGTIFKEGVSAESLKAGDEVSVEADLNAFTHAWKALAIGPYADE